MLVTIKDYFEHFCPGFSKNRVESRWCWHGGHGCPKPAASRMTPTTWRCSPVPIPIVIASTSSTPGIFASLNGWARTNPSAACTATTASIASANGKARSCSTPSCRRRRWCGSSNAWGMAARLKRRRTSARWTRAVSSGCSSVPANGPRTSTTSNWSDCRSPSTRSNWMSCTDAFGKTGQKRGGRIAQEWAAGSSPPLRSGPKLGSHGSGGEVAVFDRPSRRSAHAGDGGGAGGIRGDALLCRGSFAWSLAAADRRPFALSQRHSASVRPGASSPSQAGAGPTQLSHLQASSGIAGGRGGKSPQCDGQTPARENAGVVRRQKENRAADPQTEDRPPDQHRPCGTSQRHDAQSAGEAFSPQPQRFAAVGGIAVVAVAVAGSLQLGASARLAAGTNAGDGPRIGPGAG